MQKTFYFIKNTSDVWLFPPVCIVSLGLVVMFGAVAVIGAVLAFGIFFLAKLNLLTSVLQSLAQTLR